MAKYQVTSKDIEGRKLKKLATGHAKVIDAVIVTDKGRLTKLFEAFPIPKADRDRELRGDDGFFVLLNPREDRPHNYKVQRQDGGKEKVGDVLITLDVGAKKSTTALNDAIAKAQAIREGKTIEEATGIETLFECYQYWIDAKPMSRNTVNEVKSPATLKEAAKAMTFCKDWHMKRIADITSQMIILRANGINRGTVDGTKGSKAVARSFLSSLSAIVNVTEEFHETPNRFRMTLNKHFPKPKKASKKRRPNAHRVLTEQEIALILSADRKDFRIKTGRWKKGEGYDRANSLNITQWRKILAMKFQLLSGFRIGGVIGLKLEDINDVSIDREEMDKTGNEHRLPITTQLRAILDEAIDLKEGTDPDSPEDWMLTDAGIVSSPYLFSFSPDGSRFDAKGSVTSRLWIDARKHLSDRQVGGLPLVQGKKQSKPKEMQSHDCRVTLRVFARRCGLSKDQAKDLLGHSRDAGDVTDDYDDYEDDELVTEFDELTAGLQKIHDRMFAIAKEQAS